MQHPFRAIPANKRALIFVPLLVLTLLLMVVMSNIGRPLVTGAAPSGIVSFELAGSVSGARRIIESWSETARLYAAFSLGLDFVYLAAYSTTIGFACVWAADVIRSRGWPLAGMGSPLAWGLWLAALLDAIENVSLIVVLFGSVVEPWPFIARWCAIPKFILILAGLIYVAYSIVVQVVSRLLRR